jgi:hypothetical protein
MSVASTGALSVNTLFGLNIFFAKEPAPAGDPQTDMDKTVVLGPPGKKGPTPPNLKERILFLVLVLIIVGGGGYLAVNPEALMGLLGEAPGEAPPPLPPKPKVARPAAPAPTQQAPVSAMAPAAPVQPAAPEAGTVPAPVPSPPSAMATAPAAPAPTPMPVAPTAPVAVSAPSVPAAAPKPTTASAIPSLPTPKFGEGEKVSVSAPTPLTADAAGKKPGTTTAAPGSTLVVLDADLQNYAWVYSVRTEQGTTGWVAEKNLVAK